MKQPISYTDAEIEQIRNDPKYIHEFQNDGFNWFAVDENGAAREHKTKPHIRIDSTDWWDSGFSMSVISNYTGNWRESLQERIAIDEQVGCKITEIKEKNAASGWVDGLPPAGEVCEVSGIKHNLWTKYTILAYHGIHAWVIRDGTVEPANLLFGGCKFRPILTPKQRAIEAADKALSACSWRSSDEMVEALYDAGILTLPGEPS